MGDIKYLKKVYLASDVYAACLQHALTNEKEEILGLLIGNVDEDNLISHIFASVVLHRSDKQPDRVEISPEQLYTASGRAEELAKKLQKPMRVLGWYHSHPHITVWPSHVDVQTQSMYQMMDPLFIGLIFSVYQNEKGSFGNNLQLTCFQAYTVGSQLQRLEIPIEIVNSQLNEYNLENLASLPKILVQEEMHQYEERSDDECNNLASLHNDAIKTVALVDIVALIALPLCDSLEARLQATNARIKELEKINESLSSNV